MKKISKFDIIGNIVMIVIVCYCLLPLLLLLSSSLTDNDSLIRNGYSFWPSVFSLKAYEYLISSGSDILRAYGMSFLVTGVGTVISILITTSLAYAISKANLPGKKILTFYVFFTMLFNGGLVPTYLMYTGTFHIGNTFLALLIPNLLVRAYYIMLMRSYFMTNLPGEVMEAAAIDGASEFSDFPQSSGTYVKADYCHGNYVYYDPVLERLAERSLLSDYKNKPLYRSEPFKPYDPGDPVSVL